MRRLFLSSAVVALALVRQAGCVQSQYVPNIFPLPTPTPVPSAPPMTANPAVLILSASASSPSTLIVSQPGAVQPPFMILGSSTCLTNNNVFVFSQTTNISSSTFLLTGRNVGQCVLVFGGIGGVQLTIPVTVGV